MLLGPRLAALVTTGLVALVAGSGAAYGDTGAPSAPGDPVDIGGVPLPGDGASTDPGNPTALAPGLWSATLPASLTQHFTYERRINGSTVHVGVTGTPTSGESDGLAVTAEVTPDDASSPTTCGSADDASEFSVPFAVLGASLAVGAGSGSAEEACRSADTVQIHVDRGFGSASDDLSYAIKVVEEAPTSDPGGAEEDELTYTVPEPAEPAEGTGGSAFADAPVLDPADAGVVTVSTTITEGSELLWRVPLGWGDVPVARVDVPAATGADAETFEFSGPDLTLHWVGSMRGRFAETDSGSDDTSTGQYVADEAGEGSVLVAAGLPVRRANGRLPGDHWVSLAVSAAPDDREPVDVPVELTIAVDHVDGAVPTHDEAVLAQDRTAGPEGYAPERPFLVAEDVFAATASGSPVDESWLSTRRWIGIGVAVVSVGALALGAVRWRVRR